MTLSAHRAGKMSAGSPRGNGGLAPAICGLLPQQGCPLKRAPCTTSEQSPLVSVPPAAKTAPAPLLLLSPQSLATLRGPHRRVPRTVFLPLTASAALSRSLPAVGGHGGIPFRRSFSCFGHRKKPVTYTTTPAGRSPPRWCSFWFVYVTGFTCFSQYSLFSWRSRKGVS